MQLYADVRYYVLPAAHQIIIHTYIHTCMHAYIHTYVRTYSGVGCNHTHRNGSVSQPSPQAPAQRLPGPWSRAHGWIAHGVGLAHVMGIGNQQAINRQSIGNQ